MRVIAYVLILYMMMDLSNCCLKMALKGCGFSGCSLVYYRVSSILRVCYSVCVTVQTRVVKQIFVSFYGMIVLSSSSRELLFR